MPPGAVAVVSQHAVLWLFLAWPHAAKFAANLHSNLCTKPFATRVFGVNRMASGLTSAPAIEEDVLNYDIQIDARGLHCPEPLMLVKNKVRELTGGDVLHILATDPTTERDFEHFCQFMKHDYLGVDRDGWQGDSDVLQFWIRKQA
jgi:tRNA 2-thiouridine synthesizing protein A